MFGARAVGAQGFNARLRLGAQFAVSYRTVAVLALYCVLLLGTDTPTTLQAGWILSTSMVPQHGRQRHKGLQKQPDKGEASRTTHREAVARADPHHRAQPLGSLGQVEKALVDQLVLA